MAIPVSNPPPKYEPVPPRPSHAPDPDPSPPRPGGADPRRRGCFVVLGIAGALLCIASTALATSCRGIMQLTESQVVHKVSADYRTASVQLGLEHTHASDLHELERLADAGELSLVAFSVLTARHNDAVDDDGHIDADELHLGMELVHDIVLGHGSIDLNHYPAGR